MDSRPRSPTIGTDAPKVYGRPADGDPSPTDEDSAARRMQTPGPIEYQRATSVENAIALMEERGPDARVIAGGHSLLPMMKLRLANPSC